jgi:hypothetical protein
MVPDQEEGSSMVQRFVGRRELREALDLSDRGLDKLIKREGLTTYRFSGRLVRYDAAEVQALLERASRRAPASATGVAGAKASA